MTYRRKTLIIVLVLLFGGFVFFIREASEPREDFTYNGTGTMRIESSAFGHEEPIPVKYTCDGDNISPPLMISGTPDNAKSLVLIADDPDAPAGTWVHWTAWNVSPDTSEIAEGSVPAGAQEGITSFGGAGYGGPCPPSGTHRYFFKIFALDTTLDIDTDTDVEGLEKAMEGHVLDKAGLVGLYARE